MQTVADDQALTRALVDDITVRAIDVDNRKATFVAATENGVMNFGGLDYLRMSGVNLKRYKRNPVVLNAHNRFDASAVIGRAAVSIDAKQHELIAEITFATTPLAEQIWTLVRDKFVSTLSIGFIPDPKRTVQLADAEVDGAGAAKIVGPGRVIKGWELFEISVVPVPADAEAVRRALSGFDGEDSAGDAAGQVEGEQTMETKTVVPAAGVPAPAAEPQAPAPVAPAPEVRSSNVVPLNAERQLALQIREIAPRSLAADIVDGVILKAKDLEEARGLLLAEHAKKLAPIGTPEPAKDQPAAGAAQTRTLKDISDDELSRILCGPSAN